MSERLKLTTYLASAIEHGDGLKAHEWKGEILDPVKGLGKPDIGIYDPVGQESNKTGKSIVETGAYVTGLKRGGHWDQFHKEMQCIWWGKLGIQEHCNKTALMMALRNRFLIDGNRRSDFEFWGDVEAVIRSNFIIVYMSKLVRTVGTIREVTYAEMFNIPIYLILPDQTRTEANSTLVDMVKTSGGKIFYSAKDCVKYIKERYNI